MTTEELIELMESNETYEEQGKFERVENKLSSRPDLHAFILLNQLLPGEDDIISGADHEVIFLDADLDKLAEVITEEQVMDLRRCGVYHEDDCLKMFV